MFSGARWQNRSGPATDCSKALIIDKSRSARGRHDTRTVCASDLIHSLFVTRIRGCKSNVDRTQPAMKSAFPPSICRWISTSAMDKDRDDGVRHQWLRRASRYWVDVVLSDEMCKHCLKPASIHETACLNNKEEQTSLCETSD